ncbi:NHLP leader peptide family RiPP precursor [Zobellia sp. B3R18]|uniref:NHLP leader peptide family RiPP precursor n=1 Tax=Zobellia sp. B3R18 TaxID=2841568 RepID=UPI001C07A319|nr:NHLP leader peptide family RiPP precursor [Zobellia sp. B3R18]MBU2974974.1 NHLP leader peptide family RiPP precursor [Zobellia sp. B3R18]
MKLTAEQKKNQALVQKIITTAWEDEAFKKELLVNPIAAIEKAIGETIQPPQGKTLVVTDQTDNATIYINIPAKPNLEDMELNEEQLEAVAGGDKNNDFTWDQFRFLMGWY